MTALCRLLCALLLTTLCGPAFAADPLPPTTTTTARPQARLTVANRTIFVFRTTLAGFSPDDRAEGARKRLDAVLAKNGPQRASIHPINEARR